VSDIGFSANRLISSQQARKCRKKRKEEVNNMQEKLKSLEEENVKLRAISAGQVKPEADMMTRKRQLIEELEDLLEKDADEQVVMEKIQDYAVKFGSSGDQRRADLKQALDRLEELVRASNAKKLAFFTVEQVDTANSSSQPEGPLSPNDRQRAAAMLFKEIGFTEEQRTKLRSRKLRIQDMQLEIQQSVQMVNGWSMTTITTTITTTTTTTLLPRQHIHSHNNEHHQHQHQHNNNEDDDDDENNDDARHRFHLR